MPDEQEVIQKGDTSGQINTSPRDKVHNPWEGRVTKDIEDTVSLLNVRVQNSRPRSFSCPWG